MNANTHIIPLSVDDITSPPTYMHVWPHTHHLPLVRVSVDDETIQRCSHKGVGNVCMQVD